MAGVGLVSNGLTRLSFGGDSWLWDAALVSGVPIVNLFSLPPSCDCEISQNVGI
jgi:hypothetical protein